MATMYDPIEEKMREDIGLEPSDAKKRHDRIDALTEAKIAEVEKSLGHPVDITYALIIRRKSEQLIDEQIYKERQDEREKEVRNRENPTSDEAKAGTGKPQVIDLGPPIIGLGPFGEAIFAPAPAKYEPKNEPGTTSDDHPVNSQRVRQYLVKMRASENNINEALTHLSSASSAIPTGRGETSFKELGNSVA